MLFLEEAYNLLTATVSHSRLHTVVVRANLVVRPDEDGFFHRWSRAEDERHEAEPA